MPDTPLSRLARIEEKLDEIHGEIVGRGSEKGILTDIKELREAQNQARGAMWAVRLVLGGVGVVDLLNWWRGGGGQN